MLNPVVIWVVVFIGMAIACCLNLYFRWRTRKQLIQETAQQLASHFGGHAGGSRSEGFESDHPIIRLGCRDWDCQLELIDRNRFGSGGDPCVIKLISFWPDSDLRIQVTPQSTFSSLTKMLKGIDNIELGNWRFDYNYTLQANKAEDAKDRFSNEAASLVATLNAGSGSFTHERPTLQQITTTQNTFLVSVTLQPELKSLVRLVEDVTELLGILAGPAPAIQFIEDTSAIVIDSILNRGVGAACLVCGETIGDSPFRSCALCSTPHHKDCWEYFGGCAIYACGCKKAR